TEEHMPSNQSITTFGQPNEVVQDHSFKTVSSGVFRATIAVLLGICAILVFVKLRPAIVPGLWAPTFHSAAALRRAALDALLAKEARRPRRLVVKRKKEKTERQGEKLITTRKVCPPYRQH